MLKLKNVSKYYYQDGIIASGITKINLELFLGEFVVITGESGSGKSTLLNVLSGLDTYEDGEMYINGKETSHYSEKEYLEYRKKYVSNIFQNFNLVNSYTVYQNIELAMLMNGGNKKDIKKKVNELINKVGLNKYKHTKASKLSGGQKQRVAIARALAYETPIIVCDEPTGALDSKASNSILELLHEISHDKLVIIVTHNKAEIEKYATRLIRMHDGKILENKIVNPVNLDKDIKNQEIKNITNMSKIQLGIRNVFNLPVKFCLMLAIFFLIIITLVSNYGGTKNSLNSESAFAYSLYFVNSSDLRIIIKKDNKEAFTNDDYNKIKEIKEIDYIVENDLVNDYELYLDSNDIYLNGSIYTKKINKVSVGKLPVNDNELVIIVGKNNDYIKYIEKSILNEELTLENVTNNKKIKVTGILYLDNYNDYAYSFYLSDNLYKEIIPTINSDYITLDYQINDNNLGEYFTIMPNKNVLDNECYMSDELQYLCENNNCQNNKLNINYHNIYFNNNKELVIKGVYNKDNAKKNFNIDYDDNVYTILVSENDYNKLYNLDNYQSSVFIKDIKDLDLVVKKLNDLGYNTLELRKAKLNEFKIFEQIFKIINLIITIILVATVFFITYFIIRIIYKSRNSYYATLRSLGASFNDCVSILRNEIITFVNISYTVFVILICLIKNNIIKYEYLYNLTKYIGLKEYILVYLILLFIAILISHRYARKIFKESIMKNYGERI